mgnify:CR=1 FL=1
MFLRSLSTCLLLWCIGAGLQADPAKTRLDLYYGIAEGNFLVGDLRGAEQSIDQMLRIAPNHVPALTLQARVRLDRGKPELALESADRAIELEPGNLEHPLLKALILGQMGRRDQAADLIQGVLALTGNEPTPESAKHARAARQLLGLLRMAEGDWDRAAETFNQIYLSDPATAESSLRLSSEAYLEKARNAIQTGDSEAAIVAVDQAIATYRGQTGQAALQRSAALRLMRARLLAQYGQPEAAIADLQALTGQQPENFEALITLASIYASVGRWASLEALIPGIAARPGLQDVALYLEGRAALARDRVGTARAKFEAALKALPDAAEDLRRSLFFYRGVCLQRLDRLTEAQNSILNAVDAGFRPETSEEALVASRALLRSERAAEAIPLLEAITLNRITPTAEVWAMLGRAHLANETPSLALSAFNEALRIDPNVPDTRALRASVLRQVGDLEGALADYERAQAEEPESAPIAYARGLVQLQLGQIAEAYAAIAQAAEALPGQAGIQLLHALLAYALDEFDTARGALKHYQQAVSEPTSPSALYLDYLLNGTLPEAKTPGAVWPYFGGTYTLKQGIDAAGQAATPEMARRQICTTAFWMAQYERKMRSAEKAENLLGIARDAGHPDLIEYQLARWQLQRSER